MKTEKYILIILAIFLVLIANAVLSEASDYIIGEEDVLQISVWKNPELST